MRGTTPAAGAGCVRGEHGRAAKPVVAIERRLKFKGKKDQREPTLEVLASGRAGTTKRPMEYISMTKPPKLFVSYSWSTPEHEQWVLDLATGLRESGVDVILDKWDLKEGHDSVSFMEKMVTDPEISKVLIVSDKMYAEKADGRAGGVGTETQIISKGVYEKQDQEKFVVVIPVKDEHGKPYLPTYYKSRIYIDLSESERYAENFDKLLRWIYGKPLHQKPEVGKPPSFLDDGAVVSLGTTAAQRRLLEVLRSGKSYATGALDEFLSLFANNMERFRVSLEGVTDKIDEPIVESIEQFAPYLNEFVQVITAVSQYLPTSEVAHKLQRFFERIYVYMHRPEKLQQWNTAQFDNFKFIVHELFLYTIAGLVKAERFELADVLISTPYYIAWHGEDGRQKTISFADFRQYMESFKYRDSRLSRLSARADLLKKRAEASGMDFRSLMQADFILFVRADLENDDYHRWWPESLLYSRHSYGPFEMFARSESKAYFNRAKVVLGINSPDDLKDLLETYRTDRRNLPRWQFDSFDPKTLMGFDRLATRA
jgi:hypothetical protein